MSLSTSPSSPFVAAGPAITHHAGRHREHGHRVGHRWHGVSALATTIRGTPVRGSPIAASHHDYHIASFSLTFAFSFGFGKIQEQHVREKKQQEKWENVALEPDRPLVVEYVG